MAAQGINWRDSGKIDPCFDEMVKTFLRIVKLLRESPNNGFFSLPVNNNVIIKRNNEEEINHTLVQSYSSLAGEDVATLLKKFITGSISPDSEKTFLELVSKIPGKSREYYQKNIEALFEGRLLKNVTNLKGDKKEKTIKKNTRIVRRLLSSLLARLFFCQKNEIQNNEIEMFENPELTNLFKNIINNYFSQIAFLSTIEELTNKEDEASLIKAIRIDKSVVSLECSTKLMLDKGQKTRNRIAYAIKDEPLKKIDTHHETYLVLKTFWRMGLDSFKYEELYYFLKDDCGLIPPAYPHSFERFVREKIKPLYNS